MDDDDTAFREDVAGFSAYTQVKAKESDTSEPILDVLKIKDNLEAAPEESAIRSAGEVLEWGLNFGIVELPIYAAVASPKPVENVTVYFDDQGWIVAYLPKDRPAVAMWKHDPTDEPSTDPDRFLKDNLLIVAINQVLLANADEPLNEPSEHIGYYDWSNPECDAFLLFTSSTTGSASEPVQFVIPHTIDDVRASAAVLLTGQQAAGAGAIAEILADGKSVVSTNTDSLLNSANFTLDRVEEETSLHRMVVDANADEPAVGAMMLLYDKP